MSCFKRGDLVVASKPYAYVMNNDVRGQRCDFCYTLQINLLRCSQCRFVYFCNKECQASAWKTHKMECKYIRDANFTPSATMRLLAIIIFQVKKYGQDSPFELIDGEKVSLRTMPSHSEKIKVRESAQDSEMNDLISNLTLYIGSENMPPFDEFVEIYGKMSVYATDIADEIGNVAVVGRALYLSSSLIQHSCDPDAETSMNGVTFCLRAIRDLPHAEVRKVTKTYREQVELKEVRRADIQRRFFYDCPCIRCTSPENEDFLTKMKVHADDAEIILARCKGGIEYLRTMAYSGKYSPLEILDASKEELAFQEQYLGDTHIFRIKALEVAYITSRDCRQYRDSVKFGKQILDLYRVCYGPYSKTYGFILYQMAGNLIELGSKTDAVKYLQQAKEVLGVTHGEGHPVVIDICKKLHAYEK